MVLDEASAGVKVKLLDFGIARALAPSPDDMRTRDGLVLGTPAYLAPETVGPRALITPRVDLYAVGIIAYEMLAGAQPFRGEVLQLLMAHSTEPVPPMVPEARVPPALEDAIRVALAKDPSDRYESAAVMARALRDALIHDGLNQTTALDTNALGLPLEPPPPPSDALARKSRFSWLVAAAVISVAVATVLWSTSPSRPPTMPPRAPHVVVVSGPQVPATARPGTAAPPPPVSVAPRREAIVAAASPPPPTRPPMTPVVPKSAPPSRAPRPAAAHPQDRPPAPVPAAQPPQPADARSTAPKASATLEDPFAD